MTAFVIEKLQRDECVYFCHGMHGGQRLYTSNLQQAHHYPTESGAQSALEEFGLNDEKGWVVAATARKKP